MPRFTAVPRPPRLAVHTVVPRTDRAHTLVVLSGEHDLATVDDVTTTLAHAAATGHNVVVDMSDITFIDASIIGALIHARNDIRTRGCSLTIRSPSRAARRLITICNLDDFLEHDPSTVRNPTAITSWVAVPAAPCLATLTVPAMHRRDCHRFG